MRRLWMPAVEAAFVVFDAQGSGCRSYGVEEAGRRWFVKTATTVPGRASLDRACALHTAVRHPAIVRPVQTTHGPAGPTLVYQWYDGDVLNHATAHGADRRGLARFQQLPVPQVQAALDAILDAHLAVSAAGFVAVGLYDGCFLYDFPTERTSTGPGRSCSTLTAFPALAATWRRRSSVSGAVIDERTTVHLLGRTLHHLLVELLRPGRLAAVPRAPGRCPTARHANVPVLLRGWRLAAP
ncbi:serine/threonine protein kinase [Micromonospora chokoriensis]